MGEITCIMGNIHSFFRYCLYGGGMQKTAPIQEIMNKMAGRMDMLLDHHAPSHNTGNPQLDEIQMWIAADPLLADLHKRYLDLRGNHSRLLKKHGRKDPMTEIAADMADSAQCAVDTRLIEVRQNPALCAAIKAMKARARKQIEQSQSSETMLYTKQRAVRTEKRAADNFWMLFVMLILFRNMLDTTRRHLSIAITFQNATRTPLVEATHAA